MIWIIASIPFWALSAFVFLMTFTAMIQGTISDRCRGEEYRNLMFGGIFLTTVSGVLAIIAAKLCS